MKPLMQEWLCTHRAAAWRASGGSQKFGRARNLKIPTKLSASIHPD